MKFRSKLLNTAVTIIVSLFLFSCSISKADLSDETQLLYKCVDDAGRQLNDEFPRLHLCAVGSSMLKRMPRVRASFITCGEMEKAEARETILHATNILLAKINAPENKETLPPGAYPFTAEDVGVGLTILDSFGMPLHHPKISSASKNRRNIRYITHKPGGYQTQDEDIETFEEALEQVGRPFYRIKEKTSP